MTNTPHPYPLGQNFCHRCDSFEMLYEFDHWKPVCYLCWRGAGLAAREDHSVRVARAMLARKAA